MWIVLLLVIAAIAIWYFFLRDSGGDEALGALVAPLLPAPAAARGTTPAA